ncbi:hypothetical protein, partial [Hyphomonas polymorpha]|uniref:hypothetical protein n=1 Tax=Hyphomonas polymorpha TaxID=74319 RepID=UPI0019D6BBF8
CGQAGRLQQKWIDRRFSVPVSAKVASNFRRICFRDRNIIQRAILRIDCDAAVHPPRSTQYPECKQIKNKDDACDSEG